MNSSMLWILLVLAWLFLLLPMALRGRPEVRKTTAAATSTRVLHRGGAATPARPVRRAAGRHPSDPDYVRTPVKSAKSAEPAVRRAVIEETVVLEKNAPEIDVDVDDTEVTAVISKVDEPMLDLDLGLPDEPVDAPADRDDDVEDREEDGGADLADEADHDLVDEADDEHEDDPDLVETTVLGPTTVSRERRGRGAYPPSTIAERDAKRYRSRQQMLLGLGTATLLAVASCFFWQPYGFVAAAMMLILSGLYLYFLRRTAIAEQQFRAQRAARLRRHAAEDERLRRDEHELRALRPASQGLRRPGGMVVLELDDEDPDFDHLPTYDFGYATAAGDGETEYRRAV